MKEYKKIAVCIPTNNEADMICSSTIKIDRALSKYHNYKCYIVNSDTASCDGTCILFKNTQTKNEKILIQSHKKGKGEALSNFFGFCQKNNIDYAITLDADVSSMSEIWVEKILNKLIYEKVDYITPLYERSRFEASTTNHFAVPVIYALTGKYIRQPIGGDFGFNKKFIQYIVKKEIDDDTKKYGIDIYMTLTALIKGFNVDSIVLGEKIHKSSFEKMHFMFEQVSRACTKIVLENVTDLKEKMKTENEIDTGRYVSISKEKDFLHSKKAEEMLENSICILKTTNYRKYLEESVINNIINKITISQQEWEYILVQYINYIFNNQCTFEFLDILSYLFMIRAISFWKESVFLSEYEVEERISEQSINIRRLTIKSQALK